MINLPPYHDYSPSSSKPTDDLINAAPAEEHYPLLPVYSVDSS
jgi:hypothetical protein